jgi:hypothetical protein
MAPGSGNRKNNRRNVKFVKKSKTQEAAMKASKEKTATANPPAAGKNPVLFPLFRVIASIPLFSPSSRCLPLHHVVYPSITWPIPRFRYPPRLTSRSRINHISYLMPCMCILTPLRHRGSTSRAAQNPLESRYVRACTRGSSASVQLIQPS